MKWFQVRRSALVLKPLLGLWICVGVGGCVVSGKSASLDSTSRMPWFNFELKGRPSKNTDPPFRSVRAESRDSRLAEPLGLFRSKSSQSANSGSNELTRPSRKDLPITDRNLVVESTGDPELSKLDFH